MEKHFETTCIQMSRFGLCCNGCPDTIRMNEATGRWFITIGHAGFNSPTNNRSGYVSWQKAWESSKRYANLQKRVIYGTR